jgi:hypothetical protein
MVRSGAVAVVLALSIKISIPLGAGETGGPEPLREGEFESCFLARGAGGKAWLHSLHLPLPSPSRGAYILNSPANRLSAALARELGPLVARIEERTEERPAPRPRDGKSPIILLHLVAGARRIDPGGSGVRAPVFEIVSARAVHAEVLIPAWIAAWEELAASLREIVTESLGAPGEEKRKLLAGALERGSQALGRMAAARSSEEAAGAAGRIKRVKPGVRIVGTFQRKVAREWGGRLGLYASRLRMEPATPFPVEEPEAQPLEILEGCASGEEFARKVRQDWGEEALEARILERYYLGRTIHGWEVENLGLQEFEKARAAAREKQERRKRREKFMIHGGGSALTLPPWGVEVREAGPGILAEKLALKGIYVVRELPGGSMVGLKEGDLILDYTNPGEAGGGDRESPFSSPLSILRERSRSGGTGGDLRVIRGSRVITVSSESPPEERALGPSYLQESGGAVWTGELHIYLGMFGSYAFPPRYRLSPDLLRTLAPLVTRFRKDEPLHLPFWWNLSRSDGPISLLLMEGKVRLAGMGWATPQKTYEIVSARILSVELITPEWVRSFEALDGALREFVLASREAPGEEKRKRLAGIFRRGIAALGAMDRAGETEAMRSRVQKIEPAARIVHALTRRISREWGGWLGRCARAALGEEISGPIPEERPPALEILVSSPSPEEFVSRIRKERGEDGLEERLFYSSTLKRAVAPWEFGDMSRERFAGLRDEAVKAVADRKAWEERRKKPEAGPPVWEMPAWGVKLRKGAAEDLAGAQIIRCTVVEEVLPGGSPAGLEAGDILLDYERIYDIVMGGTEFGNARRMLERMQPGSRLRVIRRGRIVTVEVPEKTPEK